MTDNIDKILAATGAINFMATTLRMMELDMAHILARKPGVEQKMRDSVRAQLEKTMAAMRDIAEDLGNFLDANDIVDAQLKAITGAAFDLLYDRIEA